MRHSRSNKNIERLFCVCFNTHTKKILSSKEKMRKRRNTTKGREHYKDTPMLTQDQVVAGTRGAMQPQSAAIKCVRVSARGTLKHTAPLHGNAAAAPSALSHRSPACCVKRRMGRKRSIRDVNGNVLFFQCSDNEMKKGGDLCK